MNKQALAVAVAGALSVPLGAQAVESNFYGHVNRAIVFMDDGQGSDVRFLDSSASSSRFGWRGTADMGNGTTAGARLEAAWQSNLSGGATLKGADFNGDTADIRLRHTYLWFTGNWGTLSAGQTSDSTDGVAFADQSNAWLAAENFPDYAANVAFRDETSGAAIAAIVSSAGLSFDGGRRDLVKYDSPSFGPVSLTVSAATNSRWDAALWVDADIGGGSFLGAIGYSHGGGPGVAPSLGGSNDFVSGSASYKFSQGTNIMFAYGEADLDGAVTAALAAVSPTIDDDPEHWYIALGHDWGNNAVRVQYGETDGLVGCEGDTIGVGFVHSIPQPRVELYAGYHNYGFDCNAVGGGIRGVTAGGDIEDVDVFLVGSRVRFD